MGKLSKEVENIIKNKDFLNDPILKKFEEASKEFERMVEAGIVKRRGYTLLTITDHLPVVKFNQPQK